ncbi:hypothetical protein AYK26_02205 [Euryarchaeota archaeon SM23-78]|nr:MAG: hypothetical protein AYK26_02205 [Euryarchaeota archaeon SM23-78]MBW3000906.1 phosphotransferase [Candidatus Woesearchaeota archaeon]
MVNDEEIANKVMNQSFPGQKMTDFKRLPGVRHTVLRIERKDEEPIIARVETPEQTLPFIRKTGYFSTSLDIGKEQEILDMLRPVLGERIPTILARGQIEEGPYLVVTPLKGNVLRDVRADTSIKNGENVLYSLGELIGIVHKNFSFDHIGTFSGERTYSPKEWGKYWGWFTSQKLDSNLAELVFTPNERKEIADYIEKRAKQKFRFQSTTIIYDLHDANFTVNDDYRVSGLFDFDHTHKGPGQLDIFSIEETFFTAPWQGEVDAGKMQDSFNNGYKNVTKRDFEQDPLTREMGWFNHYLYASLSKYAIRHKRPGFTQVTKHRVMQVVREGEVDTKKFFEIRGDKGVIIPEYQRIVEMYELPGDKQ